jgi:hypothetical protein
MIPKYFTLLLLLSGLFLVACSGSPSTTAAPSDAPAQSAAGESAVEPSATAGETLVDEQGEVSVTVTPLNLSTPAATLDFEVVLDTHTVDLGMDLTDLALLTTDSGRTVEPTLWDAPQGGHHVSGVLSFPAEIEGASLLDGTARLTLTINDVDVPERVFAWDLSN